MTQQQDRPASTMSVVQSDDRRVPALVVGGVDESEIFRFAPPMVCDRVHWDTAAPVHMADTVAHLHAVDPTLKAYTRQWSDGQHRVWVVDGCGQEARELIRSWSEAVGAPALNLRVEAGVPFRDLTLIPGTGLADLIAAAVEWLYPRMLSVRRKLVADLDLIEDDDVYSMMYLFVSDHLDRYDAGRQGKNGTLTLLAFLIGKMRNWPQDAARQAYGRGVVGDRVALAKATESIATTYHRVASESERAAALNTSVTDLRRREQAIYALSGMRHQTSIFHDGHDDAHSAGLQLPDSVDVESEATEVQRNAHITRAIMAAVNNPQSAGKRAQDPLALAAAYLAFWEGLPRPQIARELDVLPKTATAAVNRVLVSVSVSMAWLSPGAD